MMTVWDIELCDELFARYIGNLINRFYKILPIKEKGEKTLPEYIRSLQMEMIGCQGLIVALRCDDRYISLLSILQYMIDHEDIDVRETKREVFRAISTLKKLQEKYSTDRG